MFDVFRSWVSCHVMLRLLFNVLPFSVLRDHFTNRFVDLSDGRFSQLLRNKGYGPSAIVTLIDCGLING